MNGSDYNNKRMVGSIMGDGGKLIISAAGGKNLISYHNFTIIVKHVYLLLLKSIICNKI